jgi:hemerythrin family non-heme iron protein
MSFRIPTPYAWDESFRVFYEQLDEEHKGLFNGIFACAENRNDAQKLACLVSLVNDHFVSEEAMFDENDYANSVTHKAAHDEFLNRLRGLAVPLDDAAVNYAKNWLVQHIKGIDFKYKGKLGKDTGRKAGGPFAIPEPFRWDESFRVFYELLDEEHKGLFNGIFNCSKYRGDAGKLNSLIEKVDDHFKSEEALFDERDYEGSANHKKAHDDFLRKLRKLSVPLDDGAINYAKNWLVQHIKTIDFKYRNQLG